MTQMNQNLQHFEEVAHPYFVNPMQASRGFYDPIEKFKSLKGFLNNNYNN